MTLRPRIWWFFVALLTGCDDPPPAPSATSAPIDPDPPVLRVAGTGAMTPLALRLAREWASRGGTPPVVVEPNVGSTGGLQAALDGAVDIGMMSRSLTEAGGARGLVVVPVARDLVVLAAHREVTVDGLSRSEVLAHFSGERTHYQDGTPATLVLRDRSDSAHAAFELELEALRPIREQAYQTRRFQVVFHDDAMGATLASTPGSFGVFSFGAITAWQLPLKVLALDGVAPSVEQAERGAWRATRDLLFVLRPERSPRAERFLSFVFSEEARRSMRAWGYIPLAREARSP